jgi:hypothetical protein
MVLGRPARILVSAALVLAAPLFARAASAHPVPASPACDAADEGAAQRALMRAYRASDPPRARQVDGQSGRARRVMVEIPPIAFDGSGRSGTLPTGPCQTIYRFAFPRIEAPGGARPSPFAYAEVDWNTEGMPRGPGGSFSSPHFDFHFYLRPRAEVDRRTRCVSSDGRTCDPQRTGYRRMRRFLDLPRPAFLPPGYFADTGSSIAMMGLHLLDRRATYTVAAVDRHPTLIYGTFDGQVLFSEASVTLLTLQDAMAAPDHEISFPYRQPRRVRGDMPWPTRFVVRYRPQTRTFLAGFAGFRRAGHGTRNRRPVGHADRATTHESTRVRIPVLRNDRDRDGDRLRITDVRTAGARGRVTIGRGGRSIVYHPVDAFDALHDGQKAVDRFSYRVSDREARGTGARASAAGRYVPVAVTVRGVGYIPPLDDYTLYVGKDTGGNYFDVMNGRIYPTALTVVSVTRPVHGNAYLNGSTYLGYDPPLGYCNTGQPPDDFTYDITDGTTTATGRVLVVVEC